MNIDAPSLDSLEESMNFSDENKNKQPQRREVSGWLSLFPSEIKLWASKGIEFEWSSKDDTLKINGFYKQGPMRLELLKNNFVAVDKKDKRVDIKNFDDLVLLNYRCWRRSHTRGGKVGPEPDRMFVDAFLERGWIKRQWSYAPGDEPDIA